MSLKILAEKKGILIGSAVAVEPLKNNPKYSNLIVQEFNLITPENAMKWGSLSQDRGIYNFEDAEFLVDFAQKNKQKVHGHVLVWDKQLPKWLIKGSSSKAELRKILKEHIHTVVTHFKGRIEAWDVVNESLESEGSKLDKRYFWYEKLGPEYIELAFQLAHEADPNAILFYNEWGAEDLGEKSDGMFKLISELTNRKVPINAVGLQMHTGLGFSPKAKDVVQNINRYIDMGLKVYITEMDVRIQYGKGSLQEKLEEQAKIYLEIIEKVISQTQIEGIIFWGLDDSHSWITYSLNKSDAPLLFDKALNPKPAYYAVEEALQKK